MPNISINPKRVIAELKELRDLTNDENGAQRVAWTDTWLEARKWFESKLADLPVEHHYDAAGNRLEDALRRCGVDIDRFPDAQKEQLNAAAYLELHIEQGPVLEREGLPLGVVLGTKGVERHAVTFYGQEAHSGSTPMSVRRDA